jgi:hypothetical protein
MIIEFIISAILICSLGGALFILYRKLPVLNSLPQNGTTGIREHHVILNIENKIKAIFIYFEKQIILHKVLSWTKVLTLKIETKVDHLLHGIRAKAKKIDQERKEKK